MRKLFTLSPRRRHIDRPKFINNSEETNDTEFYWQFVGVPIISLASESLKCVYAHASDISALLMTLAIKSPSVFIPLLANIVSLQWNDQSQSVNVILIG